VSVIDERFTVTDGEKAPLTRAYELMGRPGEYENLDIGQKFY
jgi:hypothetical protein